MSAWAGEEPKRLRETMGWIVDGPRGHCRFTAVQWWSLSTEGVPVPDLSPILKDFRTRGEERE